MSTPRTPRSLGGRAGSFDARLARGNVGVGASSPTMATIRAGMPRSGSATTLPSPPTRQLSGSSKQSRVPGLNLATTSTTNTNTAAISAHTPVLDALLSPRASMHRLRSESQPPPTSRSSSFRGNTVLTPRSMVRNQPVDVQPKLSVVQLRHQINTLSTKRSTSVPKGVSAKSPSTPRVLHKVGSTEMIEPSTREQLDLVRKSPLQSARNLPPPSKSLASPPSIRRRSPSNPIAVGSRNSYTDSNSRRGAPTTSPTSSPPTAMTRKSPLQLNLSPTVPAPRSALATRSASTPRSLVTRSPVLSARSTVPTSATRKTNTRVSTPRSLSFSSTKPTEAASTAVPGTPRHITNQGVSRSAPRARQTLTSAMNERAQLQPAIKNRKQSLENLSQSSSARSVSFVDKRVRAARPQANTEAPVDPDEFFNNLHKEQMNNLDLPRTRFTSDAQQPLLPPDALHAILGDLFRS